MTTVYGQQVWEDAFASRQWGKYPTEEVIRFFFNMRKVVGSSPAVLDIGCGGGACSWFLVRNGAIVTAIDGSPSALKQMRSTLAEFHSSPVRMLLGDITRPLDFVTGPFDLLIDHYSLYANSADAVRCALADYRDIMTAQGRMLCCLFGKRCSGVETAEKIDTNTYRGFQEGPHRGTGVISLWTEPEALAVFGECGYYALYQERQLHDRDGVIVEKLIFYLGRR